MSNSSFSSDYGFPGASIMWPTDSSSSPASIIHFVPSGDMLSASLSACPSTRSSSCAGSASDIEIEVLFQGSDYGDDLDCSSPALRRPSRTRSASSFRGGQCNDDGKQDLEAGRSSLLRTSLSTTEFVERDRRGQMKWSALEGFRLPWSMSQRSAAGLAIMFSQLVWK
jgi:hypothetical protein